MIIIKQFKIFNLIFIKGGYVKKKLISALIFLALIIVGFIVGFKYAINYNLTISKRLCEYC